MGTETEATMHLAAGVESASQPAIWTAADVERATAGSWLSPPPSGWTASGLSTWVPAYQPGSMVVVRTVEDPNGITLARALKLNPPAACLITSAAEPLPTTLPVLQVADNNEAILALGRYARNQMHGHVIGVTGSAGKTTCVAMIAAALSSWGEVCQSHHNANLPRGVAWNLASMPWQTPHIVLEMAIGRMGVSSRMARPQIAVFTTILPAHLSETSTVHDIARTKSAIFYGMTPGSVAILNRDMQEWETVSALAAQQQLTVINYGSDPACELQLLSYDPQQQQVTARIHGTVMQWQLAAGGRHMALNCLAALAVVAACGYPLQPALARLSQFTALAGRGEESQIVVDGLPLTLIDDAYNANPGSMQAAIERLSELPRAGRRIAILGEMAELGPDSPHYHLALAPLLNRSRIDQVFLVGEGYQACWEQLDAEKQGALVSNPELLKTRLLAHLQADDTLMFKGSNSTDIHQLVKWIAAQQTAS